MAPGPLSHACTQHQDLALMLTKRALEEIAKGVHAHNATTLAVAGIAPPPNPPGFRDLTPPPPPLTTTMVAPLPLTVLGSLPSSLLEDLLRVIERQVTEHYPRRTAPGLLGTMEGGAAGTSGRSRKSSSQVNGTRARPGNFRRRSGQYCELEVSTGRVAFRAEIWPDKLFPVAHAPGYNFGNVRQIVGEICPGLSSDWRVRSGRRIDIGTACDMLFPTPRLDVFSFSLKIGE